jgi:predicted transcriptional regulator
MSKATIELSDDFAEDVGQLISYYEKHSSITYSQAIGALSMVIYDLNVQAANDDEDQ